MKQSGFELLAPAGSFDILKAVIAAGADAVYVGGDRFGARAYANNFSQEELLLAIDYAHLHNVKLYLTVNTLLKNKELEEELLSYLLPFYQRGLDAVLVQDFGVLSYIHKNFPDLPIHTSTQMTVTGVSGVRFLQKYGVTRVVMAREVSLAEMRWIREETGIELEAFVHGALCYSYSGQCLFSSLLGGRSGNRGRCAQPCRLPYEAYDVHGNMKKRESYLLSLKDLCGISDLPQLLESGIYSLKLEGRMKQLEYAAGVVSIYRKNIDLFLDGGKKDFSVSKEDLEQLLALGNRCGFTSSYYRKQNDKQMVCFEKPGFTHEDSGLYEKIRQKYTAQNPIPIEGEALFACNRNAKLSIGLKGESHKNRVSVTGPLVEAAQKAPLQKDDVKKRIMKTGNSEFAFENCEVLCEDGIFVPNGAINQLKRDALNLLREQLLSPFWRKQPQGQETICRKDDLTPEKTTFFSAEISTREQLHAVLDCKWITAVYVDTEMFEKTFFCREFSEVARKINQKKKSCYLSLPRIFRKRSYDFFDSVIEFLTEADFEGFLVSSYDALGWVKEKFPWKKIRINHNLYTYNNSSVEEFHHNGIELDRVPLELNKKEISARNNTRSEMLLYGYYPLMLSAQCVYANSGKCEGKPAVTYLQDRMNKRFPVRNHCFSCYNVVYNSLPTILFSEFQHLKDFGLRYFSLSFTVESEKQTKDILSLLEEIMDGKKLSELMQNTYTYGHYKRGVE